MPVGVPGRTSVQGAMHGNVPAGTGTAGSRGAGAKQTPPQQIWGFGTGRCRKRKERGRGSVFCWELWSGQHA